jgi:hypothetical protein
MIDALLYSVRDAIRVPLPAFTGSAQTAPYDDRNCDIMPDGRPKPNCGEVFLSVHENDASAGSDNCLMEYMGFLVTVTQRVVKVPLDRVGDQLLAVKLAKRLGFNKRCEQLRALLHMNWGVLQDANTYLCAEAPAGTQSVYGFVEPARYRGRTRARFEGGDWLGAEPDNPQLCLVSELRFDGARRLQALATFV